MSKGFIIVVSIVVVGFAAFFMRLYKIPKQESLYAIPRYFANRSCSLIDGQLRTNCRGGYDCLLPYKDAGKPCNTSEECRGECIITLSEQKAHCIESGRYVYTCTDITGHCEKYPGQLGWRYENGRVEDLTGWGCATN